MNLLNEIETIRKGNKKAVLCIIVQTKGSTPRKVGAKMIVKEDGSILGTIGGGNLEKTVIENGLQQIKKNEAKLYKHDLLHQHSMCCGGSVEIYIEPIQKMNKLYIFGAGHTGNSLAKIAADMNFDIYVIDDRKDYLNDINSEGINKMSLDYKKVLPSLPFDKNTYIVIMTYEHSHDRDILSYCIKQPYAYLGMIGSERKVKLTKKMFTEGKLATKKELDKVDMPMGIDINAEGPEEIAISILAKLIAIKNG
ncbi:MAG: xanthine dehydrogenase [Flavobacteriales bacterium]|nr:MAG: xanthine dehydrogenase [Flavobacteriales bacterium]